MARVSVGAAALHLARAQLFAWGGALPEGAAVRSAGAGRPAATARRGLLLRLEDAAGCVGFGEATPLDAADLDAARAALCAHDFARAERSPTAPSARFALETALGSLAARRAGIPLALALAGPEAALAAGARAPIGAFVGADTDDPEALGARARAAAARGIATLKLKSTGGPALAPALAIVGAAAPDAALRVDFNGSLRPDRAGDVLRALAARGVASVEEPVAGTAFTGPWPPAPPIFADESIAAERGLDAALARRDLAGLVLKPLRDGLGAARAIADRARAAGQRVFVTHAFDGPVALATAAHLALALGARAATAPHGVDRHEALAAFPALPLPTHDLAPGWIALPDAPGLGLEEALERTPLGAPIFTWTR